MSDLFAALPALRASGHPLLAGRRVNLIGVSAILRDEIGYYFKVSKPAYWGRRQDGTPSVGIGGIGGGIREGEGVLSCLRREVQEELGVGFRPETPARTALLDGWQVVGWLELSAGRDQPTPYCVSLFPPRLGGAEMPDALAIVALLGRPEGQPRRGDLFGLLTVAPSAVREFLGRPEWPLAEALAHPGLAFDLAEELPPDCRLRPVLTARAFGALLEAGSPLP